MSKAMPAILVFDSGAGGLSVAAEIRQHLPGLTMYYQMDDAAFPYGIKEDAWLEQRIVKVCTEAVERLKPTMLVVACNTASTLALRSLREQLSIPVVGVVPAIKTAASLSSTGRIGLLATPATITRPYIDSLIRDFAPHCSVSRFGSSQLVEWAEELILNGNYSGNLESHLGTWLKQSSPSHVVLGCTHFPLLRPWLETLWPEIAWVDSGSAIARRVTSLLQPEVIGNLRSGNGIVTVYRTSNRPDAGNACPYTCFLGNISHHQLSSQ